MERITTVDLSGGALMIVDQTLLPGRVEYLYLRELGEIVEAIRSLRVRGAPAIGVAAAIGLYVLSEALPRKDLASWRAAFAANRETLGNARPTAVNLRWALTRMAAAIEGMDDIGAMVESLRLEALAIRAQDIACCRAIGEYGKALLKDGMGVLTHCNAGALATVEYGTALAPVYAAHEAGAKLRLYCTETRPLLQGARLTAFELSRAGIDTTLLCDNMADSLMRSGKVDIIFVGADHIAANGDVVNKIGTAGIAAIARRYGVPLYCCAPTSTIDLSLGDGGGIEIEQRAPQEVTSLWYAHPMAPEGIGVYNPAFDLTDSELVAGIVTEKGIARAPYAQSLRAL